MHILKRLATSKAVTDVGKVKDGKGRTRQTNLPRLESVTHRLRSDGNGFSYFVWVCV
jgi:hypothetical protein